MMTIHFYCLIPLYKEEIDLKNSKGLDALLDRFETSEVSDVINIHRKNSCPKKKGFFGLWQAVMFPHHHGGPSGSGK